MDNVVLGTKKEYYLDMNWSKNAPLWAALLIPVGVVVAVALSLYLPRFFATPPAHDFMYAVSTEYYYPDISPFVVREGKLVKEDVRDRLLIPESEKTSVEPPAPVLYRHSVATNESTEISFAEAQALKLDPSKTSPDGYSVEQGNRTDGIFPVFFASPDYATYYLTGHGQSKKLNLKERTEYPPVLFLGWTIEG